MRLINTKTGEFKWVEDPRLEHYAILSHVWARKEDPGDEYPEQNYQDLLRFEEEARLNRTPSHPIDKFSAKLKSFCQIALEDGFELGWVDTCCIDKTSSSELSEAINSMYSWYGYSGACYTFLRDVTSPSEDSQKWKTSFKGSEWFKRGWTLQELIASPIVIFVSKEWKVLGSKHTLAGCISSVTNIDIAVLTFETSLEQIPIARRMAWMQYRKTTRLEDEAYCLMGIFGVGMQTNYGEGRYAFIRLQEKILLQSTDQTIFAWGRAFNTPLSTVPLPTLSSNLSAISDLSTNSIPSASFLNLKQYLLAPSPQNFDPIFSANIICLTRELFQQRLHGLVTEDLYQVFDITPYGLRTHFPLLNIYSSSHHSTSATRCAILACEDPDKGLLALLLRPRKDLTTGNEFFAGAIVAESSRQKFSSKDLHGRDNIWDDYYYRLAYITQEQIQSLRTSTMSSSKLTLYRTLHLSRGATGP